MAQCQQILSVDARFNAYRAQSDPGFKSLYLRRRGQLLQNLSDEGVKSVPAYLSIRASLLQQRYKISLDQLSQRSAFSTSVRSGSRLTMDGDLGSGSLTPFRYQGKGPDRTVPKGQVVPTHRAEASRAIVGGASIAENYAFSGVHHIFDQHKDSVTMVKFGHNDASLLCCASLDGNLTICKLDERSEAKVLFTLQKHTAGVTAFDWSSSNDLLVSSGMDGRLCLWNVADGSYLRSVPDQANSQILSCIFHPLNSNWIAAGNSVGFVQVMNVSTGRYPTGGTSQIANAVTALTFDSRGLILWAGSSQGLIVSFKFDIASGKLRKGRRTPVKGGASVTCLSARTWASREARNPSLLVNVAANALLLYRVTDDDGGLKLSKSFTVPHLSEPLQSAFSPMISFHQGSCVVTGSEDGKVWILDIEKESKPLINKLQGHSAPVLSVSFSYDESFLASSDASGLVIVWKRKR